MLKLENVSKFYYNNGIISTGFSKINLELKLGEFVIITGESGSGKSTLLNVISGLDSYEEGEMYINGKETSHYVERDFEEYRKKYISNIFQNYNLINSYTVYQNVELVLLLNGYKKKRVKNKILEAINQVGLTEFKNTKVSKLSGGQKQRVAIARAIVKDTPIIVADEPTGNLDSNSAKDVIEVLKKVAKDKLVVVVTHNIEKFRKYATKIIKMNDGKIIENIEIKNVIDNKEIKESVYKNTNIFNKCRLGIRNTFNIPIKFLLLFSVFFFICSAILVEYASFQMLEEKDDYSYSLAFDDLSENRVLIKKADRTSFTLEDYKKIKDLPNIDYIVEDDIFLDSNIPLVSRNVKFNGNLLNINNLRGSIDIGRMPQNEDEVIIKINKNHYDINWIESEVINKTFSILKSQSINSYTNEEIKNLTIVGIQYNDESDYNATFYVSESILNELRSQINKNYSNVKVLLNNKYQSYSIEPCDLVEKGKALVDDEFKYQYKNNRIKGQPLNIYVNNIYYNAELNLNISNTYKESNFKQMTGLSNYKESRYRIFINMDDYNSLYNKPSYQSSVFVKEEENIDETIIQLNNMGIEAKKVSDFKINQTEIYQKILEIIKIVVTIILVIVLFGISYLVIKLILKSRNIYYTTLRMLGATRKNVKAILNIELFITATLAYVSLLTFIYVIKLNFINIVYIANLSNYLGLIEYLAVYILLILISKIVSLKFTKKLFNNTTINTYNEEV